jgi:anti-sigma B factor antagonist
VDKEPASGGTVKPLVIPEIVTLPEEIDIGNAGRIDSDLRNAFRPGVAVVIADMTLTRFCDSSGVRVLLSALEAAHASRAELRIVIPDVQVLRILTVLGVDRLLSIYPSLGTALTAGPPPHRQEPPAD